MFKLCSGTTENINAADGNNESDPLAEVFDPCPHRPSPIERRISEEQDQGVTGFQTIPSDVKTDHEDVGYKAVFDELFDEMCMRLDDREDWSGYLRSEDWLWSEGEKETRGHIQPSESAAAQKNAPDSAQSQAGAAAGSSGSFLKRHRLDFLLYALLLALIVSIFSFRAKGGPVLIGGYGVFTVATSSMNDVLPQGCLIVTRHVDPDVLAVGDDITFMNGPSSTVTHRIIGIKEVSEENQVRQFYTQGTMNPEPDLVPVAAPNVVGRVIYSSLPMGQALQFVKENWPLVLVVLLIVCVWISIMKNLFGNNRKHQHK